MGSNINQLLAEGSDELFSISLITLLLLAEAFCALHFIAWVASDFTSCHQVLITCYVRGL